MLSLVWASANVEKVNKVLYVYTVDTSLCGLDGEGKKMEPESSTFS